MIPLDTDHSGLNKFSGEDDVNFKRVLPEIQRMVEGGGSIVTERYRVNGKVAVNFQERTAVSIPISVCMKSRLIKSLSSTRVRKTSPGIDRSIC